MSSVFLILLNILFVCLFAFSEVLFIASPRRSFILLFLWLLAVTSCQRTSLGQSLGSPRSLVFVSQFLYSQKAGHMPASQEPCLI